MRVPESRPSWPWTDESCRLGWADGVLPLPAARTHRKLKVDKMNEVGS